MTQFEMINAPAGSGKSTEIKSIIREWSATHPNDKMLVITYTNRAADELKTGLSAENVDVGTIHSYLGSFARSLFGAPQVIAFYLEQFQGAIEARIANEGGDEQIEESNARYRERLGGPLTFELISSSINSLYYNERQFNSLYTGGLSHDGLLSFVAACVRKFPAINRRINTKYRRVIIDEYQDTSVDVLDLFLNATAGSDCSVTLYGDRMQQIYKSDLARFHEITKRFDETARTVINYRSSPNIVSTLNNIYNDGRLRQEPARIEATSKPRAHFTSDPNSLEASLRTDATLTLSVHNSTIFASFGSLELFKAVGAIPQHSHGSQFSPADVLMEPDWEKVQNPLIRFLYGLLKIEDDFERSRAGNVIRLIGEHPGTFGRIPFERHEDKRRISKELSTLFAAMRKHELSIRGVIESFQDLEFLNARGIAEYLSDSNYSTLLDVPFEQVRSADLFNRRPHRSTQHGVKGESHEKVIFMAETSRQTPVVHMGTLFDLWPDIPFSLDALELFVVFVTSSIAQLQTDIGTKISDLNANTFDQVQGEIADAVTSMRGELSSSPLFDRLYRESLDKYLKSPNVTNAKNLLKSTRAEGLLAAYKLFYVGCSRARTELDVIIPLKELIDTDASRKKFEELGFEVTLYDVDPATV